MYEKEREIIEKLAKNKKARLEELEEEILAIDEAINNTKASLEDLVKNGDLKAYNKAKESIEKGIIEKEFKTKRLEQIKKEEFITEAEAKGFLQDIRTQQEEALEKAMQLLSQTFIELEEILTNIKQAITEGNDVISAYHVKVRPFNKVIGYKGEEPVLMADIPIYKEGMDLLRYIDYIRQHPVYNAICNTEYQPKAPASLHLLGTKSHKVKNYWTDENIVEKKQKEDDLADEEARAKRKARAEKVADELRAAGHIVNTGNSEE